MTQPIKKILFTTFILLALYTLYTVKIGADTYVQQQQWQENAIKAQRYLFRTTPKSVIVGSSLSAKLTNVLPNYYNLAFHGQGNCDGLRIILEKNELPDTVFIEMNTLLVPENETFTGNMTNPALNFFRKNVLPFREGKQPLPLVVTELDKAVKAVRGNVKGANSRGKALANQLLAAQVKKHSVAPSAEAVQAAISQLRKYVNVLTARKVTVIFFELPVHPKLCDLPLNQAIRRGFFTAFPKEKYLYLNKPDCKDYVTTDGIHFTVRDAGRYTQYFKTELTALNARSQTLQMLDSFFK